MPLAVLYSSIVSCAASRDTSSNSDSTVTATLTLNTAIGHFSDAVRLSVDRFQNLYVIDQGTNGVYKISSRGDSLRAVSGFGTEHYQFNSPSDVDARQTNSILIADYLNHRIEQYTKELTYSSTLYTRDNPSLQERFGYPRSVATDDASNIYVVDGENKRVIKIRPDFRFERVIGGFAEATHPVGILTNPIDIAVSGSDQVVVLDEGGSVVKSYDVFGNFLAQVRLSGAARAIATSNDTVFVLSTSGSVDLRLLQAASLHEMGRWRVEIPPTDGAREIRDLASSGGSLFLLSRDRVYRTSREPRTGPSTPVQTEPVTNYH